MAHLAGGLACVEVELKPLGVQWDPGGAEGRVLEVAGPVEGVGDQGEGNNLEEGGLEARVPLVAGQIDQGREQGAEAGHHDLEDQKGEGGGPVQEVEVLEDQGDQVDQEGDVGDPASHLCHASSRSCPPAGRD